MQMFFIIVVHLLFLHSQFVHTQDFDLTLGHTWDQRNDTLTIYFDIFNSSMDEYRYYFFNFRPFASQDPPESFPRQRLIDTHNSLRIIGLHDNDYVSCVSFIDEYETIFKPRSTCYEFTIGEKTVGSHHGGSTGYLAPLLVAFAFVIHVFIAVVHHIKAENYAGRLLHRFIDVNPKTGKPMINVKHSLKQLDRHRVSASVQRRLSRVSIGTDENNGNHRSMHETPVSVLSYQRRRVSSEVMQTIPEYNP